MLFIPQWFMMTIVMLLCQPMKSGNLKPHLTASNVGSISRTAASELCVFVAKVYVICVACMQCKRILTCERISIKQAPSLFQTRKVLGERPKDDQGSTVMTDGWNKWKMPAFQG